MKHLIHRSRARGFAENTALSGIYGQMVETDILPIWAWLSGYKLKQYKFGVCSEANWCDGYLIMPGVGEGYLEVKGKNYRDKTDEWCAEKGVPAGEYQNGSWADASGRWQFPLGRSQAVKVGEGRLRYGLLASQWGVCLEFGFGADTICQGIHCSYFHLVDFHQGDLRRQASANRWNHSRRSGQNYAGQSLNRAWMPVYFGLNQTVSPYNGAGCPAVRVQNAPPLGYREGMK